MRNQRFSVDWRLLGFAAVIGSMGAIAQSSTVTGVVTSEFVFASASVPFAECHASTVAESGEHLVAAWFGGSGEGRPDVGIWLSLEEAGRWTEPTEVATGRSAPVSGASGAGGAPGERAPPGLIAPYLEELD